MTIKKTKSEENWEIIPGDTPTEEILKKIESKKPKKNIEKSPSLRQQKAIKIMQEQMEEKGGKINKGKILEEAGYSPSVQATPDKVFKTSSMKRVIKSVGLDLRSLKIKHKQLLNSGRVESVTAHILIPAEEFVNMFLSAMQGSRFLHFWDNPMNKQRIYYFIIPDSITQTKVLEMGYKIIGEFAPEKHDVKVDVSAPIVYLPDNNRTTGEKLE